jgi:hypothetical protein
MSLSGNHPAQGVTPSAPPRRGTTDPRPALPRGGCRPSGPFRLVLTHPATRSCWEGGRRALCTPCGRGPAPARAGSVTPGGLAWTWPLPAGGHTPPAQCITMCSVSIRADKLLTPSPFSSPSRAHRGPSLRPTYVSICQPQPPTNSDALSDPRSPAQPVVRTTGWVRMTTGARLRSRVRGKRARGVLTQRWMERSLHRLSPTAAC